MSDSTAIERVSPAMSFGEIEKLSQYVAKSGLFACKTSDAAMTLMMLAQAENLHPIMAMRQFHIIEGRPTMRADAMQARFQQAGGKVRWITRTSDVCEAEFTGPDGNTLPVKWTMDDAKQAGLTGKDNWRKYSRSMLTARVISEGVRAILPGVVVGIYTPEEASDFDTPTPQPPVRHVVVSEVIDPPKHAEPQAEGLAPELQEFVDIFVAAAVARGFPEPRAHSLLHSTLRKKKLTLEDTDQTFRENLLAAMNDGTFDVLLAPIGKPPAATKASETPPPAAKPADVLEATDAECKSWGNFLGTCMAEGEKQNVPDEKSEESISLATKSVGKERNPDEIPVATRKQWLNAIRRGQWDWEHGKIIAA